MILLQLAEHTNRPTLVPYHGFFYFGTDLIMVDLSLWCHLFFEELHSTTRTHTFPYEYTYANPTPMSTSEGLSTGRSGDSRNHHWRLVIYGNVAYHLTHNAEKSRNKYRKRYKHHIWTLVSNIFLNHLTIELVKKHQPVFGCSFASETDHTRKLM
jgi:hypothetical protein